MSDLLSRAQKFVEALPHARDLRMKVTEADEGTGTIEMPYDEKLIGDPETRVIAGGAVSALMDTCCGLAVINHPLNHGVTATLDLRIDYMRPANPGETITSQAECFHVTRSVAFVRAQAWDAERETPVAMATGAFTVQERSD